MLLELVEDPDEETPDEALAEELDDELEDMNQSFFRTVSFNFEI